MRKLIASAAVAVAAVGVLAIPAFAGNTDCTDDIVLGQGVYFVYDEADGTWLYAETNGQSGLQRGGTAAYDPFIGGGKDGCQQANPDLVIF